MQRSIKYIITVILFTGSLQLQAQDFIFSQIANSSFLNNPALTGHVPSAYRMAILYRSQWANVDGGFQSYSFTGDMNRFSMTNNNIGLGIALNQETSMNGRLVNNMAAISWAYHIALDAEETYYLSIGMQGGLFMRRYNTANLKFASGLLGGANEIIDVPATFNPDLRIGANWTSYLSSKFNFKMGIAYLHVGQLKETIVEDVSSIPDMVVVNGEAEYYLNDKTILNPSFLVLSQGGSRQYNFGTSLIRGFEGGAQVFAGVHWRYKDAIISSLGYEKNKIRVAISYDFTTSPLAVNAGMQGSFELSFSFIGQVARTRHVDNIYERDYFNID